MKKEKFIILDWAGNLKFFGEEFNTFEDAWDYLLEEIPNEEDLEEFQVINKEEYNS